MPPLLCVKPGCCPGHQTCDLEEASVDISSLIHKVCVEHDFPDSLKVSHILPPQPEGLKNEY